MKHLWITVGWIMLTGLCGCKSAEPTPEAPTPDPPEIAKSAEAASEGEPLEAVRRERAGIDLGTVKVDKGPIDGRQPAARLIAPKKLAAPARLTGEKVTGAKAARAFVLGPWKSAAEQSDPAKFIDLLDESFTGMVAVQGDPKPANRETWPGVRGGLGLPTTLSNISIAMVGSEKGDATVTFHEQTGEGESCVARTRELTLSVHSSGALRVRVVTESAGTPCGEHSASQVAAAHQLLVKLWTDEDRLEAASTTPSVWLRDFGLDAGTYDRESLHQGEGRWLLQALASVEATEENTIRVGTVGEVKGPNGQVFSYHWTQERWTLQGLDRVN